jgi:DNA-binding HxlR family transcriptional regulator
MEPKWKKLGNNEKYVNAILSLIMLKDTGTGKGVRFNELERNLRITLGLPISKPTLSKYLKNMVNEKLLVKIERNKLDTEYKFNEDLINKNLDEYKKINKKWSKFFNKEEKEFLALSVKEQLYHAMKIILWRNLSEIRIMANPEGGDFKNLELYYLENPRLRYHERLIMAESRKDEQYRTELFKEINSIIEELDVGD